MQLVPPEGLVMDGPVALRQELRSFFVLGRGCWMRNPRSKNRTLMLHVKTGQLLVRSSPFSTSLDLRGNVMVLVVS